MNKEYFQISHSLTLLLTTASVFLSAWTILGSIAAPGGTVFALLALIVLALLGGEAVRLLGSGLSRILRINVCLPPLLGMLVVGIALKNIPYNFGQFGRAECTSDHRNASFVDSIHDLDQLEEHRSFKRSVSQLPEDLNGSVVSGDSDCSPRYIGRVEHSHKDNCDSWEVGWHRKIIILLTPAPIIDPFRGKPNLCQKDTAKGKKCL